MMRVRVLSRQAEMASQLNPDLGREWAAELFALSHQLKGNRSQVQNTALGILHYDWIPIERWSFSINSAQKIPRPGSLHGLRKQC
jgi:hypothetical protein